jgi:hypothetical protein
MSISFGYGYEAALRYPLAVWLWVGKIGRHRLHLVRSVHVIALDSAHNVFSDPRVELRIFSISLRVIWLLLLRTARETPRK